MRAPSLLLLLVWKTHETYWENKLVTAELVRNAGFPHWTIILPSTFMDHPMVDPAGFIDGRRLVTSVRSDRPVGFIAPEDVGAAAAAAILDPARFHGVSLELAGDILTLPEAAAVLSRVDGKDYVVESGTAEEAIAAGLHPGVAHGVTFMNFAPLHARPEIARSYGLAPMPFETWLRRRRTTEASRVNA